MFLEAVIPTGAHLQLPARLVLEWRGWLDFSCACGVCDVHACRYLCRHVCGDLRLTLGVFLHQSPPLRQGLSIELKTC